MRIVGSYLLNEKNVIASTKIRMKRKKTASSDGSVLVFNAVCYVSKCSVQSTFDVAPIIFVHVQCCQKMWQCLFYHTAMRYKYEIDLRTLNKCRSCV